MMSVVIDGVLNFYTVFSRMAGFTIHAIVCNDLYSMIVDPRADPAMRHSSHHEKRASSKNRNHVADRLHGASNRASCRWRVKRLIGVVLGKISTAPRTGRALLAVASGTPALPCQVSPIGSGHGMPLALQVRLGSAGRASRRSDDDPMTLGNVSVADTPDHLIARRN